MSSPGVYWFWQRPEEGFAWQASLVAAAKVGKGRCEFCELLIPPEELDQHVHHMMPHNLLKVACQTQQPLKAQSQVAERDQAEPMPQR